MNHLASSNPSSSRIVRTVRAAALALACTIALPVLAGKVTPPQVPDNLKVAPGSRAFLVGHAVGTQNYVCAPTAAGVAYTLFTPIATLFNGEGDQLTTHFFSPNPNPLDPNTNPAVLSDGAIRATWQHARDNSSAWARLHPNGSATVTPGALAWLLLDVVGVQDGLAGGDILSKATQIQRVNTMGGIAPSQGCASTADLGRTAIVDYTADYYFYTID